MSEWLGSNEEINEYLNDNPSVTKPKFLIGDKVKLLPNAYILHEEYIQWVDNEDDKTETKDFFNKMKNNELLITAIVIYDDTDKKYYSVGDPYVYISEPCLFKSINYNIPKKLVYEKLSFSEFLFESTDLVSFIISDELEDVLSEIKHPISTKLLMDSSSKPKSKITLLDVVEDSNKTWYFVNSIKAIQFITDKGGNPELSKDLFLNKEEISKRHRSIIGIGKVIKKLYNSEENAKN